MLEDTLTIILAGGQGSRLMPLTAERAKPAVPFGGKYRIIDFTLNNCLHSGLRRVLVLTQYKSHSLQKHLRDGWSLFNPELGEYITVVPPQMRTGGSWYEGTTDAVHQNLYLLKRSGAKRVLILSGDHIYRMDYAAMLAFHDRTGAELTIGAMELTPEHDGDLGILAVDADDRITGIIRQPESAPTALASMGIYCFSMELLLDALEQDHARQDSGHDFVADLIPRLVTEKSAFAYRFGGAAGRVSCDRYWRDVEDIDGYYEANMELLNTSPAIDLYQPEWPIRTYNAQYPPARTIPGAMGSEGIFINSIAAGGVVIVGGSVQHSILFPHVKIGEEAVVHDAILFNNVQVGEGAELDRCIVDKDVTIPPGERIGFDTERDAARFTISDKGIVVVPKGYRFS